MPQRSLFAIVCCPGTNAPPVAPPPSGLRLGRLVGRPVHDARGMAIGHVDDVIVPANGSTATAILSLDGDRLVSIPLPRLRLDGDRIMLAGEIAALPEYCYA